MEFTIKIEGLQELSEAIALLGSAIGMKGNAIDKIAEPSTAPATPMAPVSPVAPATPVTPVTPVAPVAPATPVTPVTPVAPAPAPQAVPTQKVSYSINQLSSAAMQLKDQGRIGELQALLQKYGAPSMVQLTPDQLDGFAADLIAMGVKL